MIGVVQNPELKKLQGKRLSEIAQMTHKDAMDALFDLLIEDKGFTACAVFGMSEPDLRLLSSSHGSRSITTRPGTSPEGCSARSIRILGRMELSREFCASMFAKRRS